MHSSLLTELNKGNMEALNRRDATYNDVTIYTKSYR